MQSHSSDNKRIAKNTGFLYLRMLFQLAIGLYTSRIVINALGVVDYGIYNVVGSVVAMLSFLNGTLSTTTTRFLNYNMVGDNLIRLRTIVCTSRLIHLIIGLAIVFFAETVGLYYLYNYLVVPPERFNAAFWCYHFSVLTCFVGITNVPNNALIIANEKMSAFAYISIYEVSIKLLIAFLILLVKETDILILYGALLLIVAISNRLICQWYCGKKFPESKGKIEYDKKLIKEMAKFAGWIVNGSLAVVAYTQGVNLLINAYFGPAVNAARGIAVQVQSKIMNFCINFQTAVIPQITKSYASGDYTYLHSLIINTTKYSFFLMYLLSFPIIIQANTVLHAWLGLVPDYAVNFLQLTLVVSIIESLKTPLNTSVHATGKIKKFQMIEGGTLLTILPLSYISLKLYPDPRIVFIVQIMIFIIVHLIRSLIACPMIHLSLWLYFWRGVLKPLLILLLPSFIVLITQKILSMDNMFLMFSIITIESVILIAFSVLVFGCDKSFRERLYYTVKQKVLYY